MTGEPSSQFREQASRSANFFVNRDDELARIAKHLSHLQHSVTGLYLAGEGGIGKTAILTELYNRFHGQNSFLPEIIDFDEGALLEADNFEQRLLSFVYDDDEKHSILIEIEELYRMEKAGDSPTTLLRQRQRILAKIADALGRAFQGVQLVLRFDTVEKINFKIADRLSFLMTKLWNASIIFAGRPESSPILWNALNATMGKDRLKRIDLEPFDEDACQDFLRGRARARNIQLSAELRQVIIILSRGMPILMELSVEYVVRALELDGVFKYSVRKLQRMTSSELEEARLAFEIQLVSGFANYRDLMSRLTLVLSRVYPLEPEAIAELLDVLLPKAEQLYSLAKQSVYIKTLPNNRGIMLHDQMRVLVGKHVWDEIDKDRRRRKRDSQIAAEIFQKIDEALHKQIKDLEAKSGAIGISFGEMLALERRRETATENWLEHALFCDLQKNYQTWYSLIQKIRRGRKYELTERLAVKMQPYFEGGVLAPSQEDKYRFVRARVHLDMGHHKIAEDELRKLLAARKTDEVNDSSIHNLLGIVYMREGNYSLALEHQQKCRSQLLDRGDFAALASVENQIGYLYRLMEDFDADNLQKSLKHFGDSQVYATKAYDSASQEEQKGLRILIAGAQNNIGYVHGLLGNFQLAETYCGTSIDLFREMARSREMAWAETSLGILRRDAGQYERAVHLLSRAASRLKDPDDFKEICRVHLHLGWALWFKAFADEYDSEPDIRLLEDARIEIEKSLQFVEKHSYAQEMPAVYHQLASVVWQIGLAKQSGKDLEMARRLNSIAIEKSRELNNIRYLIDSLIGEVEFALDVDDFESISGVIAQLREQEAKYGGGFPLYFGRLERMLGDFAFRRGYLDDACEHYAIGIPLINTHGGFGPYSIDMELHRLADRLSHLSSGEAREWLDVFEVRWRVPSGDIVRHGRVDLVFWCKQQSIQIQIRKPKEP